MHIPAKKIIGLILPLAVLLISIHMTAHAKSPIDQPSDSGRKLSVSAPDLAEVVPSATKLKGRLAAQKIGVAGLPDISEFETNFEGFAATLEGYRGQLQGLKNAKDFRYRKLLALREAIRKEDRLFEETSRPVSDSIRQLETWRMEWLAEKNQWREWQTVFHKEKGLDQLTSTFEKAHKTIDTALDLILTKLRAMLSVQAKTGNILAEINALSAELDGLILDKRRDALLVASPPMFSLQYISQFKGLWSVVRNSLSEITWPGSRFFAQQGWIVLLQGFVSIFVMIAVFQNRRVLTPSKRWSFLASRPVSTGLFLGYMLTMLFYEYVVTPAAWKLAIVVVAGISFVRLADSLNDSPWKRQFLYGLIGVLILTRAMDVISFPQPLFRLYLLLTALACFVFCLRWAGESARHKDPVLYNRSLRVLTLIFTGIIIVELWGKALLALYLFDSLIRSLSIGLVFMLFIYMLHGGVEWLFLKSPLLGSARMESADTTVIIRKVSHFIDAAICGLVLMPAVFLIWGVYDSLDGAMKGLLTIGFTLGSQRITLGLLIVSAGILYGSFLISWILQKLLMDEVLMRSRVEKGVRLSIGRLVHYVIIFAGFLLAISTLGVEVTKITIMLSALGVGIGFGLQGIVNNFVSGLILLFERPVRVGDSIEIGGKWAEIRSIGIRATTVQTIEQADLIIPNADLINNQVTNWTLSNRKIKLRIPVGVAYGSDVPLVMETLVACAKSHQMVADFPPPQVLFLSFGESSLDFELRALINDADRRLQISSEVHQEIDRRFREAKIEIAFPQRDLHLRSLDESVLLQHRETKVNI